MTNEEVQILKSWINEFNYAGYEEGFADADPDRVMGGQKHFARAQDLREKIFKKLDEQVSTV